MAPSRSPAPFFRGELVGTAETRKGVGRSPSFAGGRPADDGSGSESRRLGVWSRDAVPYNRPAHIRGAAPPPTARPFLSWAPVRSPMGISAPAVFRYCYAA